MAAVTFVIYGKTPINLFGGETAAETKKIDWLSDTIKAALFTATYTPNQDTDELYSGITGEVANGNGYTTGGNTCGSTSVAYVAPTSSFDAANPANWVATGAGFSYRYVVVYDATTDVLIGYMDLAGTVVVSAARTVSVDFDPNGIFALTVPTA